MLEAGIVGAKLPIVEKLAKALKVEPASMLMKRTRRVHRGHQVPAPSVMIADNITLHRLERLMTQARLAHKTGIAQMQISALERGKWSPTLNTLDRVATGLKVKVGELLGKPSGTLLRIKKYARFGNTFAWRGYVTE
jgi:DNA-binding XRE family transcriptional regulator